MTSRAHIDELRQQADDLPEGAPEKVALLEEAIRLADTLGEEELCWQLRMALMPAATWSGELDKMLVAFTWLLAKLDEAPEKHSAFHVLWYYKWAVGEAPEFPQLSRARIETLLDDMERRYQRHGLSLRPVFQQRYEAGAALGDEPALLEDHYRRWWAAPRDAYADCVACESAARVRYFRRRKEPEQAVRAADELFARRLSCAHVPNTTYALTLFPLLRLGRVDDALKNHRTGVRMLARLSHNNAWTYAEHAALLAVTGNTKTALSTIGRQLQRGLAHKTPSTRADVLARLALVCDCALDAGTTHARLPLEAASPLAVEAADIDKRGRPSLRAVRERAWAEATRIGALYDARNGNRATTDALEAVLALRQLAVDAPLKPRATED